MFTSFAVTIGASRAINYVRERRRPAPRLRSWARRMYHAPGQEKLRVHHFMPGIALAFLSGTGAILGRNDGREFWFSIPFGIGAGLTFDQIAILTELDDPYWAGEKLAAAQAAIATTERWSSGSAFTAMEKRPAEWPAARCVRLKRTTAAARPGFAAGLGTSGLYEGVCEEVAGGRPGAPRL